MNFCTQCGQPLVRRVIEHELRERLVCDSCQYVHYENPKLLVWCYAHWRDQLVLCRRAHEPAKGLLNPPAGFVEAHETLEEAAIREVSEEVGLHLPLNSLILYRVASIPHINQVYVGFRAELTEEPRLVPGPEVTEARLYAEHEIPLAEMAFREMLADVPQDFFRSLRSGHFSAFAEVITMQGRKRQPDR